MDAVSKRLFFNETAPRKIPESLNDTLSQEDREIAKVIADLGAAAETELVARTLKPLSDIRQEVGRLVRRRSSRFGASYGDSLELTPEGYKSLD
jgi:hypothetical protein